MAARSLNKVLLIGNLTRDPELRYTPSGTAVASFGIATNREWVDGAGQKQEETEFHNIVAWSKLAEICSQLLFKGRKVYVEGRMATRTWTGQDNQERRTTEIVIEEMIAFGPGKVGGEEASGELGSSGLVDDSGATITVKRRSVSEDQDKSEREEQKKPAKKAKKNLAEEVADDIPF